MTSADELQTLFFETLSGNGAIMAIANYVYDSVPEEPFGDKTAYISFGPYSTADDDADCISSVEATLQVDVWSKTGGQLEAKTLTDLVRKALHHKSLSMNEHALVDTHVAVTRVFPDPSGIHHGVVTVRALVEELS